MHFRATSLLGRGLSLEVETLRPAGGKQIGRDRLERVGPGEERLCGERDGMCEAAALLLSELDVTLTTCADHVLVVFCGCFQDEKDDKQGANSG